MRFILASLIASTLSAWLAAPAEPVSTDEARPPATSQPAFEPGERPGQPGFGGGPPGRRGGRWGRGPEAGPDAGPLSPEDIERLMNVVQRHFPNLYEHLEPLRQSNPMLFDRMLARLHRPLSEILHATKENPKVAEKLIEGLRVEMELHDLRRQFCAADSDGERAKLREQMRGHLETRFDLRLTRLRWEIRELQKRLDDTKKQLEEKERDKSQIINAELDELTSDEHGGPPGRPGWWQHKRDAPRRRPE